jgi:group I intron endonuclease
MIVSGVYKILNRKTGKFYIGSSKDIKIRWRDHRRALKKGTHINPLLQRAWNKTGKDHFDFIVLEECVPDLCLEREQHYLDTLKPFRGVGYNIGKTAGGGDNITNHPDRAKFIEKMKQLTKGELNGMYGKEHSETTRELQREKSVGRFSLGWFVERHGKSAGKRMYNKRCRQLKNRKINYVFDNKQTGLKKPLTKDTIRKISESRRRTAQRMPLIHRDIKLGCTVKVISERYDISEVAVKTQMKKLRNKKGVDCSTPSF